MPLASYLAFLVLLVLTMMFGFAAGANSEKKNDGGVISMTILALVCAACCAILAW